MGRIHSSLSTGRLRHSNSRSLIDPRCSQLHSHILSGNRTRPPRIRRASTPERAEALRHIGRLFRNVLEDKRDIVAPLDCLPAHGRRSQYGGDIPGVNQPQPHDYALAYLPMPSRENCTAAFLICASMTELEAIATSSPEQAWREPPPASSLRTRKLNSQTPEQGKATPDARE
ncbi:hypothetical protein TRAPUB_2702 [Trametes pubescens]|uniref:Uncharacterized protein n=1 Tax=Trametes pubescens TaxID=154538 RepID=A0A1M2VFX3_TRAPU|nr:hypothetical protein TRAPUB_2702 [Trametes pubescens]